MDEAATRCGLKGTQGKAAPKQNQQQAPAPKPQNPQNQNLNIQPQWTTQIPSRINLAPAGAPTIDVPVAGVTTLQLPDILKMLQAALAQILAYFHIQL